MPENRQLKRDSKTRGAALFASVRLVGIAVQLICLPIVQNAVGVAAYGVYLLILTGSVYAALVDVGFSEGALILLNRESSEVNTKLPLGMYKAHMAMAVVHGFVGGVALWAVMHVLLSRSHPESIHLAALGAITFFLTFLVTNHTHLLLAERQFAQVALVNTGNTITAALLGVVMAVVTKKTESLFIAAIIANIGAIIVYGVLLLRMTKGTILTVPAEWASLKRLVTVGCRSYGNRVMALMAGNADRLILGGVSAPLLTHYSNSGRIPDGLADISMNTVSAMRAEVAQAHVKTPERFGTEVGRRSMVILMLACAFVAIPSSLGLPLLKMWFGANAYVGGAAIACVLGYYRALYLYFSYLGMCTIIAGQAHRLFWFVVWNAAVTAGLSLPVIHRFGIVGLAVMNLGINVIQWIPLLMHLRKHAFLDLDLADHLKQSLIIVGLSLVFTFGALIISVPIAASAAWLSLLVAPALGTAFIVLCVEAKIVSPPGIYMRVSSKLRRLKEAA